MDSSNNTLQTNFSLDTSNLIAKDLTAEQFKDDLRNRLSEILADQFPTEPQKQRIRTNYAGFNFACPYCGDSATDFNKKRGHFILQGKWAGYYKCFNCNKFTKIGTFFKTFRHPLDLNDLAYMQNNVTADYTMGVSQTTTNTITSEVIDKNSVMQYAVSREYLKNYLGLLDIDKTYTKSAWLYLVNRCQYNMRNFLYDPRGQWILVLNMIDNDNVFGLQMRDLTGKRAARYKTLALDKMHSVILRDTMVVPENVNNLSTVFNIFNVNLYKPVLVTEGPFDAFLLPNGIATAGAGKNLGVDLPFWYIYDSDPTGLEHSLEKLRAGYKVFAWKKFKEAYSLPYRKKWDISDVMVWFREAKIDSKINWWEFFTSDPLDGLNL